MFHQNRSFMIVVLLLLFSGCATMIRGTEGKLDITTEPSGSLVELSNGQKDQTPCQFILKRNQTVRLVTNPPSLDSSPRKILRPIATNGVNT